MHFRLLSVAASLVLSFSVASSTWAGDDVRSIRIDPSNKREPIQVSPLAEGVSSFLLTKDGGFYGTGKAASIFVEGLVEERARANEALMKRLLPSGLKVLPIHDENGSKKEFIGTISEYPVGSGIFHASRHVLKIIGYEAAEQELRRVTGRADLRLDRDLSFYQYRSPDRVEDVVTILPRGQETQALADGSSWFEPATPNLDYCVCDHLGAVYKLKNREDFASEVSAHQVWYSRQYGLQGKNTASMVSYGTISRIGDGGVFYLDLSDRKNNTTAGGSGSLVFAANPEELHSPSLKPRLAGLVRGVELGGRSPTGVPQRDAVVVISMGQLKRSIVTQVPAGNIFVMGAQEKTPESEKPPVTQADPSGEIPTGTRGQGP